MMGLSHSKYTIDVTVDGDMINKRPRISEEAMATGPNKSTVSPSRVGLELPRVHIENESNKGNLAPIKVETLEPSLKPPVPLLQRLQIHEWDNDEDNITVVDTDTSELTWSDCGSEYRSRESSLGEKDDDNDDDMYMVIHDGPYADSIRELRRKEKSRFPVALVVKLETNRLRKLSNPGVRNSPSTIVPPSRGFVIMHVSDPLTSPTGAVHERERAVVGIAQSLEKANIEAMSYFCHHHHGHMCGLDVIGNSRQNRVKSPFMEVKEYSGIQSFEAFHHASGTRDCSAWGVDPTGCLGLLAVHGMKCFSMVYVKETYWFA
ncbi:uncharacterized protein F4807DRAFT_443085 [Annulohypoxylon truncatum]|uniref:uncharacterized protein n=1 Tax=Annulohypoxylon truncatum TaxID=327061 RepID=UPI002008952A|nr:uncharacterized protein F4807DRAFT_443085 [Annulohypoxylon truncatum]KAI1205375.1 hypothetical protein F4807DRAFT_443085 [Annulohypoxylon truncatum]